MNTDISQIRRWSRSAAILGAVAIVTTTAILTTSVATTVPGHGTVVFPQSRVYRVYKSNPERPNFALAAKAVAMDSKSSYYTWNELSRNIPEAVKAKLPKGFDYSKWVPDGQLASGGRVDKTKFPRTYAGLDQVSADWPTTPVVAGQTITVDFFATAAHDPSVWDVWMTKPEWDAKTPLKWSLMEFLGRPSVALANRHYKFQLKIPANRCGHHVLWVAWQRNDPVGEVFFSTSDIFVGPAKTGSFTRSSKGCGAATLSASGAPNIGGIVNYAVTGGKGKSQLLWVGASAISAPLCTGCTIGTDMILVLPGSISGKIPCDTKLVGTSWYIQGADITGTTGGCNFGGGLDFTLTDTIRSVVGG